MGNALALSERSGGGKGRNGGKTGGRTFLDLGLLHFVAEGLLELALVGVGELCGVYLGGLVEGVHDCLVFGVWEVRGERDRGRRY